MLIKAGITISMDGKGRAFDNIFIERLWRSVKYEEVYLDDYDGAKATRQGLSNYFKFYNDERPHQGLGYKTPRDVYFEQPVDYMNNGDNTARPSPVPSVIHVGPQAQ